MEPHGDQIKRSDIIENVKQSAYWGARIYVKTDATISAIVGSEKTRLQLAKIYQWRLFNRYIALLLN